MPTLSIAKISAESPNGETFDVPLDSSATGQTVSGTWKVTITLNTGASIDFNEDADSEGQAVDSATAKINQLINATNDAHRTGDGTERENQDDTGDTGDLDAGTSSPDGDDGGDGDGGDDDGDGEYASDDDDSPPFTSSDDAEEKNMRQD